MRFLIIFLFSVFMVAQEFNIDSIFKDESSNEVKKEIEAKNFEKDSNKEYKELKSKFYKKYEYVPPSKNNNIKHDSFCYDASIKNEGDKYFCLSFAKNDKNFCYDYKLSEAQKNICLGFCYDGSLTKAQKAFCLAIKNNNQNFCFDTNIKGSLKAMCLGRFNKMNCYSINDEAKKNICLGISLN